MQFKDQHKKKAITLSYDDGVTQDIRLIELLNKYGLKCTFNLNSERLGTNKILHPEGPRISHDKIHPNDVRTVYEGHEIAVHTLNHPMLPTLDDDEVIRQVEQDRLNLSELTGYEVVGMAYPGGGVNHDGRVADLVKDHTGVQYARTIISNASFAPQADLYRFQPSVYHLDFAEMMELGRKLMLWREKQSQGRPFRKKYSGVTSRVRNISSLKYTKCSARPSIRCMVSSMVWDWKVGRYSAGM